jgi:hexosaminidase
LGDEYGLQSWFIGRINNFLMENGKLLIGWDEILEGGLNPGTLVMSWRVSILS